VVPHECRPYTFEAHGACGVKQLASGLETFLDEDPHLPIRELIANDHGFYIVVINDRRK
jgi:hypothetical protein